jgi:hypothetical protein
MTEQEFLSGYRSWYQAHMMLSSYIAVEDRSEGPESLYLFSISGIYHVLWGALLFVVCEYLRTYKDLPHGLRSDIDALFKPLRKYRDAVFHTPRVVAPKAIRAFLAHSEYPNLAIDLHYSIRDFFRHHEHSHLLPPESIEEFESFGDFLQLKKSLGHEGFN